MLLQGRLEHTVALARFVRLVRPDGKRASNSFHAERNKTPNFLGRGFKTLLVPSRFYDIVRDNDFRVGVRLFHSDFFTLGDL